MTGSVTAVCVCPIQIKRKIKTLPRRRTSSATHSKKKKKMLVAYINSLFLTNCATCQKAEFTI